MTKQQTIETLQKQLPGFYSAEQVIKMISEIEDSESTGTFTDDQIDELATQIASEITDGSMDLVYSYDLTMNYREVELDSLDLNESDIIRIAKDAIKEFLNNK
jgi:hypothetical protein